MLLELSPRVMSIVKFSPIANFFLCESKISRKKYPVKNLGNRAFLPEMSFTFLLMWDCVGEYRSVYTVPVRSLHPGGGVPKEDIGILRN